MSLIRRNSLLIVLFLIFYLVSCSHNNNNNDGIIKNKNEIKIPEWFLNFTNKSDQYWYGTGSSNQKKIAIDKALNDIASQISITIKSSHHEIQSQKNNLYNRNITSTLNTEIDSTKIIGFEITECQKINHSYYVMIRLKKINFINNYRSLINETDSKIRLTCKKPENFSNNQLKKIKSKIEKSLNYMNILNSIDHTFEPTIYNDYYINCNTSIDKVIINRINQKKQKKVLFVYNPSATKRDLKPHSNPARHMKSILSSWFSDNLSVVNENIIKNKVNENFSFENIIEAARVNTIDYLCFFSIGSVLEQANDANLYAFVELKLLFQNCENGNTFAEFSIKSEKYKISINTNNTNLQSIICSAITQTANKIKDKLIQRVNENIERDIILND